MRHASTPAAFGVLPPSVQTIRTQIQHTCRTTPQIQHTRRTTRREPPERRPQPHTARPRCHGRRRRRRRRCRGREAEAARLWAGRGRDHPPGPLSPPWCRLPTWLPRAQGPHIATRKALLEVRPQLSRVECETCGARFRSRTQLFLHLRREAHGYDHAPTGLLAALQTAAAAASQNPELAAKTLRVALRHEEDARGAPRLGRRSAPALRHRLRRHGAGPAGRALPRAPDPGGRRGEAEFARAAGGARRPRATGSPGRDRPPGRRLRRPRAPAALAGRAAASRAAAGAAAGGRGPHLAPRVAAPRGGRAGGGRGSGAGAAPRGQRGRRPGGGAAGDAPHGAAARELQCAMVGLAAEKEHADCPVCLDEHVWCCDELYAMRRCGHAACAAQISRHLVRQVDAGRTLRLLTCYACRGGVDAHDLRRLLPPETLARCEARTLELALRRMPAFRWCPLGARAACRTAACCPRTGRG